MIEVYGSSDDLIEIDGDIIEEFTDYDAEENPLFLAFSDGTLLSIKHVDGVWRICPMHLGNSKFIKHEADPDEDTDKVQLLGGNIEWVVFGKKTAMA